VTHAPQPADALPASPEAAARRHVLRGEPDGLELLVSSPAGATAISYRLTGAVRGGAAGPLADGGSLLVRVPASGLVEEVYLDEHGHFALDVELRPDDDNHFHIILCDPWGRELESVTTSVRHGTNAQHACAGGHSPPTLEPAWPRFAQRVKECLYLAGKVGDASGRSPQELFEQVYAQERYAEKAFAANDGTLYSECFENLGKLADYLGQLCRHLLPG
jgi:hypothetical protein